MLVIRVIVHMLEYPIEVMLDTIAESVFERVDPPAQIGPPVALSIQFQQRIGQHIGIDGGGGDMQQLDFLVNEDEPPGHKDILRLPFQIPCQIGRILRAQQIQIPGLCDTQDVSTTSILRTAFPGAILLMRAAFFHTTAVFQGILVDTPTMLYRGTVPCLDRDHNVRPLTIMPQRLGDSVQVLHFLHHQQDTAEHIYQGILFLPELRSRIQEGLDPGGFTRSRSRRNDQRSAGVLH